jgi:hypothetical protein
MMRKPIYLSATCAVFVAVAVFAWLQNTPVASRNSNASASLLPHGSLMAAETAKTPAMSSTEMMINYNRPLSVEQWDAF